MSKIRVAVLFGGASSEHEVSLKSAYSVITNIPTDKYEIICIGITKKGKWLYFPGDYELIRSGAWETFTDCCTAVLSPDTIHHGFIKIQEDGSVSVQRVDVVFPVLHGKFGEDGTIQGLCELANLPYVGCNMTSSANCMDKSMTHTILDYNGIKTAKFCSIDRTCLSKLDAHCELIEEKLGYPMFVKPACAGSSIGVNRATDRNELRESIKIAFSHDNKVVIEEEIIGREIECAVLGNDLPIASLPGEIAPEEDFYTYDAKYNLGTSKLYIPAELTEEQSSELRKIAIRAYKAIGCTGFSRVDFFVTESGIILNEINTIPGFTSISMYPKLMEATGIPFPDLLDRLMTYAIERMSEN